MLRILDPPGRRLVHTTRSLIARLMYRPFYGDILYWRRVENHLYVTLPHDIQHLNEWMRLGVQRLTVTTEGWTTLWRVEEAGLLEVRSHRAVGEDTLTFVFSHKASVYCRERNAA